MKPKLLILCLTIGVCDFKLLLLSKTRSENLRDYAQIEAQKSEFFKAKKDMLVKEMIEMQLEQKSYKINLFLDSRFKEMDQLRK